jgi:hypothetical protein
MERELLEESTRRGQRPRAGWIVETRLLGYFRWIGRGGLPGFTGLTRLSVPSEHLRPNINEVDQPDDLPTSWDASNAAALADTARVLLHRHRELLSLPLLACLLSLLDVIESEPHYLDGLLP